MFVGILDEMYLPNPLPKKKSIDCFDPFFCNQLITFTRNIHQKSLIDLPEKVLQNLKSIPFILQHYYALECIKKGNVLLHAGVLQMEDAIILLLGPPGSGKSSIIGELILKKTRRIIPLFDDKVVIDLIGSSLIHGNSTFAFRNDPKIKPLLKSNYTKKLYYNNLQKGTDNSFTDIYVINVNTCHGVKKIVNYSYSLDEILLLLIKNIIGIASGVEALDLANGIYYSNVAGKTLYQDILDSNINQLKKSIKAGYYIQGGRGEIIEFILSL